jgi:hypothetical protein
MALIVEDGTGVVGADTYCSEEYADAYHEKMGNEAWLDVENKEAMLRRATKYMTQIYRQRWTGLRNSATQSLDWPRYDVPIRDSSSCSYVPSNTVPQEVVDACAELALRASASDLAPDRQRQTKSETVGPMTVVYVDGDAGYVKYRAVDAMLAPYLSGSSMSVPLVRA